MDAIWLQFYGNFKASAKNAIFISFKRKGIDTFECEAAQCDGHGLVYYDRVDDELYDIIREVSENGLKLVFAVASSPVLRSRTNHWRLLDAGAKDVIFEIDMADLTSLLKLRTRRWEIVNNLMVSPKVRKNLVGRNKRWVLTLKQILEVAKYTDDAILLMGESGTGKECIANLIHNLSRQSTQRIVVLDCTTIVPELSGSEFFGHERGAFTGAATERVGAFERADNGTLFLDEVGELPMGLQPQLLRVIQEGTYKRVGGNTWHESNFRLVSATNKNLKDLVQQFEFRADLYHRIAGWVFYLPTLLDRSDDIMLLARFFAKAIAPDQDPLKFQEEVRHYLLNRDYPGNIRELKHLITRIMQRHIGPGPVTVGDIPPDDRPVKRSDSAKWYDDCFEQHIRRGLNFGIGLKAIGRTAEDVAVRIAVNDEEGNLQQAARRLGVTDRALQLRRAAKKNLGKR